MQYFSFSVWLISLSLMLLRPIHVANGRISFFIADNILSVCIEKSYCLYPFIYQQTSRSPLYLKLKLKSLSRIQLLQPHGLYPARLCILAIANNAVRYMLVDQSCLTLCDLMDRNPPVSSVHGIFQARTQELVAIPFSRGIFPTQGLNPGLLHCRQIHTVWSTREAPVMYTEVHYLFKSVSLFSSSKHPEVELLTCMVILF